MLTHASNSQALWSYCIIFIIINILQTVFGYINGRMYVQLQMSMGFDFNKDLVQHVQHVSLQFVEKQDASYLSQRINNDANNLVIFCIGIIQNIIINSLTFAFPFLILYRYNSQIAWIVCGMTILYFFVYRLTKKPLYQINLKFQEAQSRYFGKLNEQLRMARFVKMHAIADSFIKRLQTNFQNLLTIAKRRQKVSYLFSGLDGLIAALMQVALFLIGGLAVLDHTLTIGQFTVISTYFTMLLSSARYFFGLGKKMQESKVAYTRIMQIQTTPIEVNGSCFPQKLESVVMKDVTFSYDGNNVFNAYNLVLESGKIYALSGRNGSGKSTLINLLLGLYISEYEGDIYFNGIPLHQLDMLRIRKEKISLVEQEPILIPDTIKYNLTLKDKASIDIDEFRMLTKKIGLTNYLENLSNGIESEINFDANNLSGGEKQKLAIIRALIKHPDFLILDEPTSAMDLQSSTNLIEYLNEIKRDKIILLVTHDTNIIRSCDVQIHL